MDGYVFMNKMLLTFSIYGYLCDFFLVFNEKYCNVFRGFWTFTWFMHLG